MLETFQAYVVSDFGISLHSHSLLWTLPEDASALWPIPKHSETEKASGTQSIKPWNCLNCLPVGDRILSPDEGDRSITEILYKSISK